MTKQPPCSRAGVNVLSDPRWLAILLATICTVSLSMALFGRQLAIILPWQESSPSSLRYQPYSALRPETESRVSPTRSAVAIANDAARGEWHIGTGDWPTVESTMNRLWNGTAIDNDSWRYQLHSLFILHDLIEAHRSTVQEAHLDLAWEIIESWHRCNPRSDPPCRYSWNDHSTANRAIAICCLIDYCAEHGVEPRVAPPEIARMLVEHGEFLATHENYTYYHNHGIFQDFSLLVISSHLSNVPQVHPWETLAFARLQEQLDWAYSQAGIHLENSPAYHWVVSDLVARVVTYATKSDLACPDWLARCSDLARFEGENLILPDGTIAPIGDSARGNSRPVEDMSQLHDAVLYPDAGYAILRDDRTLFFSATHHYHTHKHCDDLSLTLADTNGPLLTDPGFLNYEHDDPHHVYTLSRAAHNTVVADTTPPTQHSKQCRFTRYGTSEECWFVEGKSIRNDGSQHCRQIIVDRVDDLILVIDRFTAPNPVNWSRYFHFEPDVDIRLDQPARLSVQRDGSPTLQMTLWPASSKREILTAQHHPLQGWVAKSLERLVPSATLVEAFSQREQIAALAITPSSADITFDELTSSGITVSSSQWTKAISLSESNLVNRTTAGEMAPRAVDCPLRNVETPNAARPAVPKPPIGNSRRWQLQFANLLAWMVVIFVVFRLRHRRRAAVLLIGATIINVAAVVAIWGRL